MKITYLGTAASEGFPAVFCNCNYCREARRLKGKNIRTRSQSMINGDLLIDLPADTYMHFLKNDIEADLIKYLLVTHSHSDHFYLNELITREVPYANRMRNESLQVFCGEGVYKKICGGDIPDNIKVRKILPYETVELEEYKITALPARHMEGDGALIYIVKGDKTLLYAHDTGYLYDEVLSFIEKQGFLFDMVSFDCTNGDLPISDEGTHMGIANIERLVNKLKEMGAISEQTKLCINHFSHNVNPIHSVLEERVSDKGWLVSYDGMCVQI